MDIMAVRVVCLCFLLVHAVKGISFSITPNTFVPGVTTATTMRCDVGQSGADMSQLLLIQLEVQDRGNLVPVVTFTPGGGPRVMEVGDAAKVQVDGVTNEFQNISQSYLSVTYPFPAEQAAGNYTCVVSGLSTLSLFQRYTASAQLTIGAAVNELPRYMTAFVVGLRSQLENLKIQKNALLMEATRLAEQEQNVTTELTFVQNEYSNLANEMLALRSRAGQLSDILSQPTADLDHLSNVRPGMKVAFHAGMSSLGATTAVLRQPLVFDHVFTNQGQGYDATSGVFRAPYSGTYLFTVSVEAGSGNRDSELSIMMGDKLLQTMHMSDDTQYQHSTTSAIAHVRAGAEITCEFTWLDGLPGYVGSTEANAPYVTAFTGYIIW